MSLEDTLAAQWQLVRDWDMTVAAGLAAGSYLPNRDASSLSIAVASGTPPVASLVDLNLNDFRIGHRRTQMRLRTIHFANDIAPAVTYTVDIRNLTAIAGAAAALNFTLAAAVTGSAVSIATPAADTVVRTDGSVFDYPGDGLYALVVTTAGGATAANSSSRLKVRLELRTV